MPKRDKREHIMAAAEKLFKSRRYHEITMAEIAREASVGKGTIYQYFSNKNELFFQTATAGFDELCTLLNSHVPPGATFRERLLDACRQTGDFFQRRRQLLGLMQTEDMRMLWHRGEMREHWMRQREKLTDAFAAIISQGATEGVVRNDIAPKVLASFLLGSLRTFARELKDAPIQLESVIDLFCRGAFATESADQQSTSF